VTQIAAEFKVGVPGLGVGVPGLVGSGMPASAGGFVPVGLRQDHQSGEESALFIIR
jgi:hypothetical protein